MSTSIERVVVPLDGSELAEAALVPGARLAERLRAELTLLRATSSADSVDRARSYLDACSAFLYLDASPLVVVTDATQAIPAAAAEPGTLVCMATHGRTGIGRAVVGSVVESVVRECVTPIVLVGPSMNRDWSIPDEGVVVAAFDGSALARTGVCGAADVASGLGGRLEIVEVVHARDVLALPRFALGHTDALEQLVDTLRRRGLDSQYDVIEGVDPAVTLLERVTARGATLLALATHGRSGVVRAALGSVASRVVHRATVPVVVTGRRWRDNETERAVGRESA